MSLVRNERTKITATYLNGLAVAIFAIGSLAPIVSAANAQASIGWQLAISATICAFASIVLHLFSRRILKGLQE
jgi:hypothetical protein